MSKIRAASIARRRCISSASGCLFGIPGLGRPEDCQRLAKQAAKKCDELVGHVIQRAATPSVEVLHGIDKLSETLCSTLDMCELARNVHPDAAFIEAADSAYNQLSARMHELSTDTRLYRAVHGVLHSSAVRDSLTMEQLRFAQAMTAEFEADGAHMTAAVRARLQQLKAEVLHSEATFAAGVHRTSTAASGLWVPLAAVAALPAGWLSAFPSSIDQQAAHCALHASSFYLKQPPRNDNSRPCAAAGSSSTEQDDPFGSSSDDRLCYHKISVE